MVHVCRVFDFGFCSSDKKFDSLPGKEPVKKYSVPELIQVTVKGVKLRDYNASPVIAIDVVNSFIVQAIEADHCT